MSELVDKAFGNAKKPTPPKEPPNVSSDESEHHPDVEVEPDGPNIMRHIPIGAMRDPTYVPEELLRRDLFYYRWVNKRKIDYRKFQGYEPVFRRDVPCHGETPEGWLQLGDCVFMKIPRKLWELKVRDQEEYWEALYKHQLEKAYNELDKLEGHPFVVEPDGKEVS